MTIKVTTVLFEFDFTFIVSSYTFDYNGLCVDDM